MAMVDRRVNLFGRQRFEALRRDVMARLAAVCRTMQADEFAALATRMARVQVRFETVTAVPRKMFGSSMG
jgi:hypothetical protein